MRARKTMLHYPDVPYIIVDVAGQQIGLTVPDAEALVKVIRDALDGEAEE